MNFTIRAVKDGDTTVLARAGPTLSVVKARALSKTGWTVEIIDADGVSYPPSEFNQLLLFDRLRASPLTSRNVLDVATDILKKPIE